MWSVGMFSQDGKAVAEFERWFEIGTMERTIEWSMEISVWRK